MAAVHRRYTKSVAKRFRYFANWMPGRPRNLGDFGVFEDKYTFRNLGNIRDLNVEFGVQPDPTPDTVEHQSESGIEVTFGAGGATNASGVPIKAKIAFHFSKTGAFVLKANGIRFDSIDNLPAVATELTRLLNESRWKPQWRIITELATAETCSILISSSREGEIELGTETEMAGPIDIADASLGLKVTRTRDMSTRIVAEAGLTPLFRLHGFKKKGLFGGGGDFAPFGVTGADMEDHPESMSFSSISPLEELDDDEEE